ncbi:Nicotinamide-nucleotide adenylyltransferase [Venustampulla echinocandica]|uniref:Nicotinamide-nucleotide adenylyltransferase n=1 Tax=Venustampulla echinocandica TaxID=2656787 RepID=A0A370TLV5_9HELO|nr:Nicotinamide-nucleotide adenylyltransferase [Venustampulla echinocandica]RDL36511.1 Nicotinamide-nucleotide adenylyltransferase [Venustampulla echinocandica]
MASDLPAHSVASQTLETYTFPHSRLRLTQSNPDRQGLILVAPGSYSPITHLHLRMFEMAADFAKFNTEFELLGGYISPVGDAYKKKGLAPAGDRLRMCELAVDETSNWLMVDPWEALHTEYMPTAVVLDHFEHEINEVLGGAVMPDGTHRHIQIALLAGSDLIMTMGTPGVWSENDLEHILGRYGAFCIERSGTDTAEAISSLEKFKDNIYVIQQLIANDVSSTKIRLFLRREMSVAYLIPSPVIRYIEEHGLYKDDAASIKEKEKSKGKEISGRASPAICSSESKS